MRSRNLRLFMYGLILALLFPAARALTIVLTLTGVGAWLFTGRGRTRTSVAVCYGAIVIAFLAACWRVHAVCSQPLTELVGKVPVGTHLGAARGKSGNIRVSVVVDEDRLKSVQVLAHRETVRMEKVRTALAQIPNDIVARHSLSVDAVTGATRTSMGISNAVRAALRSAAGEPTWLRKTTDVAEFIVRLDWERETIFQLCIVLSGVLFFDLVLQSILVRNTGEALNCMKCQACVGVCPVRRLKDGRPLPMSMVLAARLGDYAEVEDLASRCVGCGFCAARCPSGISAPNVAGRTIESLRTANGN